MLIPCLELDLVPNHQWLSSTARKLLKLGEDEAICRCGHCSTLATVCIILAIPDAKTNHKMFSGLPELATPDAFLLMTHKKGLELARHLLPCFQVQSSQSS